MTTGDYAALRKVSSDSRRLLLKMHFLANAGHIGTGLSCIDILTFLYSRFLEKEDHFILSKGHAASALYATLNIHGFFSDELLETYYKDGTTLPAHPAAGKHPEISVCTGSLGHGLSVAAGMAYAHKHLKRASPARVVSLLSDGECNEGAVWEAALFAAHHKLSNLLCLIDANGLQGFGKTCDVMNLEPFLQKWQAFGFNAIEVNGHDFGEIESAFKRILTIETVTPHSPHCIVFRTTKGRGVSFMENRMDWHYRYMTPEQYEQAVEEQALE